MNGLIGKTIKKIYLSADEQIMIFLTSEGEQISFETYGDCCSSSWFSNISGLKNLLGQKVNEVVERQEWSKEEQEKAEEQYKNDNDYVPECLSLYGYLVKTNKGVCDVEFRNESNGYYGGSVDGSSRILDETFKEIKEDF